MTRCDGCVGRVCGVLLLLTLVIPGLSSARADSAVSGQLQADPAATRDTPRPRRVPGKPAENADGDDKKVDETPETVKPVEPDTLWEWVIWKGGVHVSYRKEGGRVVHRNLVVLKRPVATDEVVAKFGKPTATRAGQLAKVWAGRKLDCVVWEYPDANLYVQEEHVVELEGGRAVPGVREPGRRR